MGLDMRAGCLTFAPMIRLLTLLRRIRSKAILDPLCTGPSMAQGYVGDAIVLDQWAMTDDWSDDNVISELTCIQLLGRSTDYCMSACPASSQHVSRMMQKHRQA